MPLSKQIKAQEPSSGGIPTLSLFSGAGGLDLGFLQAGFDIRACVEIEESYCDTLEANIGNPGGHIADTVVHRQDIRLFDTAPYVAMGIECVIGGPPCQTFSAAGRRSGGVIGLEDERGQLFRAYCRVLDEIRPEIFLFENVYGLPGANGGGPWKEICEAFSGRGYHLSWEVVDAADYGVPQHRERLILVGSKSGNFRFPLPTHGPDSATSVPLVSVESAIADLQDPKEEFHDDLGGLYGHLLPKVPEGLNYSFFTAEMNHPEPVFAWRSKFHDLLYKVDRKAPCRTLKAQPGKFTGPFHWKNRHFTIAELKRLQSFPDSYELKGGFSKALEQIGNSVPPRLAFVLATSVKEQFLRPATELTFSPRADGFKSTFRQRQRLKTKQFQEVARRAVAAQYKTREVSPSVPSKSNVETYYLEPKSLFDRSKHASLRKSRTDRQFQVKRVELWRHVEIEVRDLNFASGRTSIIEISGLKKYLPEYDTVTLTAKIANLEDIFHVWGVIEDTLVSRSRFFSLIDIYGHYANRGDTVQIDGDWNIDTDEDTCGVVNFFSKTLNCGNFHAMGSVESRFGVTASRLDSIVSLMRKVRFDIRTGSTHPIIGDKRVLCTYPFPLLSPRALVESRVLLNNQPGEKGEDRLAKVG